MSFYDADLMRTETEIKKIQEKTMDSIGIKDFIENKHGIGRKGLTEADLLGGSFRSEMDAMMKMDDAAFRSLTDRPSGRMYEKEMYDAAAKVRKMSDAEVQAAAIK